MISVPNPFSPLYPPIHLPSHTFVAHMIDSTALDNPKEEINKALNSPICSRSLKEIAEDKLKENKRAKACIVISDNTRPVPYKGEEGILFPLIEILLEAGFEKERITVLIATGMHREMTEHEIGEMIDERVLSLGIKVINHLPRKSDRLKYIGNTRRGTRVLIDRYCIYGG